MPLPATNTPVYTRPPHRFAIPVMYWHDLSFDVFSEQTVRRCLKEHCLRCLRSCCATGDGAATATGVVKCSDSPRYRSSPTAGAST